MTRTLKALMCLALVASVFSYDSSALESGKTHAMCLGSVKDNMNVNNENSDHLVSQTTCDKASTWYVSHYCGSDVTLQGCVQLVSASQSSIIISWVNFVGVQSDNSFQMKYCGKNGGTFAYVHTTGLGLQVVIDIEASGTPSFFGLTVSTFTEGMAASNVCQAEMPTATENTTVTTQTTDNTTANTTTTTPAPSSSSVFQTIEQIAAMTQNGGSAQICLYSVAQSKFTNTAKLAVTDQTCNANTVFTLAAASEGCYSLTSTQDSKVNFASVRFVNLNNYDNTYEVQLCDKSGSRLYIYLDNGVQYIKTMATTFVNYFGVQVFTGVAANAPPADQIKTNSEAPTTDKTNTTDVNTDNKTVINNQTVIIKNTTTTNTNTNTNVNVIQDTNNFNTYWITENRQNQVVLSFTYDANSALFTFTIVFPDQYSTNPNVADMLFFMANKDANSNIASMKPTKTYVNNLATYTVVIPLNKATPQELGCEQTTDPTNSSVSIMTCYGILSFVHIEKVNANNNEGQNFTAARTQSLVTYYFKIGSSYSVVDTGKIVATTASARLAALPCVNCNCNDACTLNNNLILNYVICQSAEDCTNTRDTTYNFGETAYIRFQVNDTNTQLQLLQMYAISGADENGALISNTLASTFGSQQNGQYKLALPVAAPVTLAGLKYKLKVILQSNSAQTSRRLEASSRVLQSTKSVAFVDVQEINVRTTATNSSENSGNILTIGGSLMAFALVLISLML